MKKKAMWRDPQKKIVPNPGSDEALGKGCKCPVMDNEHGKGWMGQRNLFVMSGDCPLHGKLMAKAKPVRRN